jgi:hypothetical protein
VNTANANVTSIGAFGISAGTFYDATFNGNTMYLQETNGSGGLSNLYTVNTGTGAATLVGNIGFEIYALDYEDSTLYGFTANGQIVTIDTTTGVGTFLVNESSGDVYSATSASVPEPTSFVLLAFVGVTGMAGYILRRRKPAPA